MTDTDITDLLERFDVRTTRQRMALARLLFPGPARHVTAEALHREACAAGNSVSLATVYNTLNHFLSVGLLREVTVCSGQSWFDTNLDPHFHLYNEATGELTDLPEGAVQLDLPPLPDGASVERVDVIIRIG